MQALIGQKKEQTQRFLENGTRIPVTLIDCKNNTVISVLTQEKNKYQAVQLGFSMKKKGNKAEVGHAKGAKLEGAPKFLREVPVLADEALPEVGTVLNPSEIFAPGDIVDVSGMSKGKGYAGGVKRHGFHGGPKTHGQSDRHRAPGSIGQGTTPGRVYRGKRMAGKMGNDNVTIQNLKIIDVTDDGVLVIKGLVPGVINNLILINKVGTDKKFVPLWKPADASSDAEALDDKEAMAGEEKVDEPVIEEAPVEVSGSKDTSAQTPPSGDAQPTVEDVPNSEPSSLSENQPTDSEEKPEVTEGPVSDSPQEGSDTAVLEDAKEIKEEDNANS